MNGADAFAYLNAIPSAVIVLDRSLCVVFINQSAEILLGVSRQQALGRALSTMPGFDDALCGYCERVLASGEDISLFEQLLRLPMDHRNVTLHITPVIGDDHKTGQLVISIEKFDGLDRLSGNVWKQEATRAAGVMAAMMAHEVKNPLSGIRGAAQLLKDEVAPEHQALTDLICMETDRIRDLLNQVEIFGGGAVEHKQQVNIHEVLQYVMSVAQNGFALHVRFKERYDPSLPDVWAHRDLLVQMFLNLVKNAAEALAGNPDATITLCTSYRSGYRIRPKEACAEAVSLPVMVTVEDNGPGIAESIRQHLFEPFVSSKEDGRGLGLSIVAKIASDLGLVVELDKEFGAGTRFIVWLPVDTGR